MKSAPLFLIIALSASGTALLFTCIGTGTTHWYNATVRSDGYIRFGLWKGCSKEDFMECCGDIDKIYTAAFEDEKSFPSWIHAVRAMTIMGILALIGTLSLGISTIFVSDDYRKLIHIFHVIASFAAGALLLIGIIIFAVKAHGLLSELCDLDEYSYYFDDEECGADPGFKYSFILIVVALILSVISGIVGIVNYLRGQQTAS